MILRIMEVTMYKSPICDTAINARISGRLYLLIIEVLICYKMRFSILVFCFESNFVVFLLTIILLGSHKCPYLCYFFY